MTAQLPTRITIEVHPADPAGYGSDDAGAPPIVRVVPDAGMTSAGQPPHAAEPREAIPTPAAYEPGPCTCLDDEDCGADHAND
jgi:hypothetical protein